MEGGLAEVRVEEKVVREDTLEKGREGSMGEEEK